MPIKFNSPFSNSLGANPLKTPKQMPTANENQKTKEPGRAVSNSSLSPDSTVLYKTKTYQDGFPKCNNLPQLNNNPEMQNKKEQKRVTTR